MEGKKIFVVTDCEAGWDCVCGVFSTKEKAENYCIADDDEEKAKLRKEDDFYPFVIHETNLQ